MTKFQGEGFGRTFLTSSEPLPASTQARASLDRAKKSITSELSGGLGERNNERHLRSSAEAVCRPTLEWEA